jgi:acyl-CoA oxidase
LTSVEKGLGDMLSFGLIPLMASGGSGSRDAVDLLRQTMSLLCLELVPQAIGLTDAFGFTDWELDRSEFWSSSV